LRILYFSRDFTTHDLRFVSAITARGHAVKYLRLESDGIAYATANLPAGAEFMEWPGGRLPCAGPDALVGLLPAFIDVLRRNSVDLVHAGPIQTCALLSTLAGTHPTVAMSWGSDVLTDADTNEWHGWATRSTLSRAQAFVCDSAAVAAKATALGFTKSDMIARFPWGIDRSQYSVRPDAREERRRSLRWDDAFIAIATRAWHPHYRIDVVLEGFRIAHAREPRLRLVLAGTGTEAATSLVRSMLRDNDLDALVHCPGMVSGSELNEWFSAADAYVSAVPIDGTSISLLEAMFFSLPVTVVDNAGNREWVTEGSNGVLVKSGDPEAIAVALCEFAADPARAREMGAYGRAVILDKADWNRNVEGLFELYRRVAAGRLSA
jgi:glycosyltransferase involved in cell wall biosynthesis